MARQPGFDPAASHNSRQMKKSTQVALGGLSSALCLLLMFMTGLIPFSSYIFPALAGIVLISVREENGLKTALLVYAATSLLALLIIPDREAVMMYIMLLGYYPLAKPWIERLARPNNGRSGPAPTPAYAGSCGNKYRRRGVLLCYAVRFWGSRYARGLGRFWTLYRRSDFSHCKLHPVYV